MHDQELLEDTAITMKIEEDEISGSAGCNFYGATSIRWSRHSIEIREVAHTDMACPEPAGVMEQEEEFIDALKNARTYRLDGDNLSILNKHGDLLLRFRLLPKFEANPEGLKGKTWQLMYADDMEEYNLNAFTLRFGEGNYQGTTSCRDFEGIYQLFEDSIHLFTMQMGPAINCVQKDRVLETTFTSILQNIDQYNVSQNRLELYTIKNNRMVFQPIPDE
jgi:heat shock protein HslJ